MSGNRVARSEAKTTELPTPSLSSPKAYLESVSVKSSNPSSSTTPDSSPRQSSQILFTTDYFEVKPSRKQGLGAFATKDIPQGTVVIAEKPLLAGAMVEVYMLYENLSPEERLEYRSLYGYQGVDPSYLLAIFKTNR